MKKIVSLLVVFLLATYFVVPFTASAATATGSLKIHGANQVVQTSDNSFMVKAPSRNITLEATNGTFVEKDGHVYLESPTGTSEVKMDNVSACRIRGNYMEVTMTADYINVTMVSKNRISIMEVIFFDDYYVVRWTEIYLI